MSDQYDYQRCTKGWRLESNPCPYCGRVFKVESKNKSMLSFLLKGITIRHLKKHWREKAEQKQAQEAQ